MASGTQKYRYETDKGNIFYARTDDADSLAAVRGAEPTGNITESITFEVSKNSKAVGCKPRHVKLFLKGADTAEGCMLNPKGAPKEVVVLKKDTVPKQGTEVTVNGRVYVIGSITDEQMR